MTCPKHAAALSFTPLNLCVFRALRVTRPGMRGIKSLLCMSAALHNADPVPLLMRRPLRVKAISVIFTRFPPQVGRAFFLHSETIAHAVLLFDRVLSNMPVSREALQTVALTCACVASKLHESRPISAQHIRSYFHAICTVEAIRHSETNILACLKWDVGDFTAVDFINTVLSLLIADAALITAVKDSAKSLYYLAVLGACVRAAVCGARGWRSRRFLFFPLSRRHVLLTIRPPPPIYELPCACSIACHAMRRGAPPLCHHRHMFVYPPLLYRACAAEYDFVGVSQSDMGLTVIAYACEMHQIATPSLFELLRNHGVLAQVSVGGFWWRLRFSRNSTVFIIIINITITILIF